MGTARILKLQGQGEVQFFELPANGASKVTLKAPAALAADVALVLPAALPVSTEVLTLDSAGQIAVGGAVGAGFASQAGLDATQAEVDALEILHAATQADLDTLEATVAGMGAGGETLQQTYDLGEDITLTAGKTITWTQPLNEAAFKILKTGAGVGTVLDIENDGAGIAVVITQDGANAALAITQNSLNSALTLYRVPSGSGSGAVLQVTDTSDGAQALRVDKIGTGAGTAVTINNAGTGAAVAIAQTGGGVGFSVSKTGASSFNAAEIVNDTAGTGKALTITQNGPNGAVTITEGTGGVSLAIGQGNSASHVVTIQNSGSGLYFATSAGGTIGTTGAKLTNAGVWTDGTCFAHTKRDIVPVANEAGWLDNLDKLKLVRWTGDRAPQESPILSPLQDELVTFFGFDPERGTSGREIATVALVCLRALHVRFKAALLRISALEAVRP